MSARLPGWTDYFTELVASHSWSTVKLDLYGLKFYYAHVLRQPWVAPGLIKPPKTQRLPDIVTVAKAKRIFAATRVVRYRDAKSGRIERRTVSGADFLWLVLQHVLPKGFRRARNFGFLHPNCKRLIALLHVILKFAPGRSLAWVKERAPILCTCCGAAMVIVRTRIRSAVEGGTSVPIAVSQAR